MASEMILNYFAGRLTPQIKYLNWYPKTSSRYMPGMAVVLRGKCKILTFSVLSHPIPHWFKNVFANPVLDCGTWGFPSSGLFTDFLLGFADFQVLWCALWNIFAARVAAFPKAICRVGFCILFNIYMPLLWGILFWHAVCCSASVRPAFSFM